MVVLKWLMVWGAATGRGIENEDYEKEKVEERLEEEDEVINKFLEKTRRRSSEQRRNEHV